MKKLIFLFSLIGSFAMAEVHDGSDIPACHGVTDVCMHAAVTFQDSKTHQPVTGYAPGEHEEDAHGLWAYCVHRLAKGEPVEGVSGVSKDAAKACQKAEHAAHPPKHPKKKI
jgi:hypothetical protein